jgi:hypothetical protein
VQHKISTFSEREVIARQKIRFRFGMLVPRAREKYHEHQDWLGGGERGIQGHRQGKVLVWPLLEERQPDGFATVSG